MNSEQNGIVGGNFSTYLNFFRSWGFVFSIFASRMIIVLGFWMNWISDESNEAKNSWKNASSFSFERKQKWIKFKSKTIKSLENCVQKSRTTCTCHDLPVYPFVFLNTIVVRCHWNNIKQTGSTDEVWRKTNVLFH